MQTRKVKAPGPRRSHLRAWCFVAALSCVSCRTIDAKVWNLNQLHNDSGGHQYHGALEGDWEYFFRHQVAAMLTFGKAHFADKSPDAIKNPATECLDYLIKLQHYDGDDPIEGGIQVQWFARLAVDDVAELSRERCVLGLGQAGARLQAGRPVKLAKDVTPAGAEATSAALAGVVNSVRPRVQRRDQLSATERANLEAACQVVSGLALDLNGARRALRVTNDLMRAVGQRTSDVEPLFALSDELQRSCVRQSLAQALVDPEPVVRAAAVEATVACAGSDVLDPILAQLSREPSPIVIMRVLDMVARVGLPKIPADVDAVEREKRQNLWLASIYGLLLTRTEGEIHVGAMLALAKVSGSGIKSLREEDWQAWWRTRVATPAAVPAAAPNG